MELIRKGAEADACLAEFGEVCFPWSAEKVLIKKRISKGYRTVDLGKELRSRRTLHEAPLLHEAKSTVSILSYGRIIEVLKEYGVFEYGDYRREDFEVAE